MRAANFTLARAARGALAPALAGLGLLTLLVLGNPLTSGVAVGGLLVMRRRETAALGRRLVAEQGGFALVEVMVSAVLVVVAGTAVLKGIDGSQRTSRENRARSVAAELAQQDQERLRAFKVTDLSNYHEVRNLKPGNDPSAGGPYQVDSRATWVNDSSGTINCTNSSSQANYLQITSTVTWPDMAPIKPVTATSLVAPPAGSFGPDQGSLAIQVLGGQSQPVEGVTVSLSGTNPSTDTTDSNGCVVFGYITAGTYTATLSKPGYVDPAGNPTSQQTVGVVGGATTLEQYQYDQAATVHIGFDTVSGGTTLPGQAFTAASLSSAFLPAPNYRTFTANPAAANIDATNVFPMSGGYSVYAGSCKANDPLNTPDGSDTGFVVRVNPAPGDDVTTTARLPLLALTARYSNGAAVTSGNVKITPPSGCGSAFTVPVSAGAANVQLPFGTYTACVFDGTRRSGNVSVTNYDPAGNAGTLTISTTDSTNKKACA